MRLTRNNIQGTVEWVTEDLDVLFMATSLAVAFLCLYLTIYQVSYIVYTPAEIRLQLDQEPSKFKPPVA